MYTLADAARILRVSPSKLRYWNNTVLARAAPPGRVARGLFDFRDLVELRALRRLTEQGFSPRRIRRTLDSCARRWPSERASLAALRVSPGGARRIVLCRDETWEEADGQLLFDLAAPECEVSDARQAEVTSIAAHTRPADAPAAAPPQTALGWFERGCELDQEPATFQAALEAYHHAIVLDPGFADAHCNLGAVHFNLSERAAARCAYQRALELAPGHLEANFNLASLLEESGRNTEALRHYKVVVGVAPFFGDARLNLALLYEKLEEPGLAREQWRHYLRCVPADGHWAKIARERLSRMMQPQG